MTRLWTRNVHDMHAVLISQILDHFATENLLSLADTRATVPLRPWVAACAGPIAVESALATLLFCLKREAFRQNNGVLAMWHLETCYYLHPILGTRSVSKIEQNDENAMLLEMCTQPPTIVNCDQLDHIYLLSIQNT